MTLRPLVDQELENVLSFDLFTSKKSALIGVDVGRFAIKMVEIVRTKTGFRIENFAIEPLASGVISDGLVNNPDELSEAIRRCHSKMATKTKSVALGLPMECVFIKRLVVNAGLSEADMESEVARQLSSLMSIDPEEINIDFQNMPSFGLNPTSDAPGSLDLAVPITPDGATQQDVIAMAAKREKIDERVSPLENAGLKAVVIDSEILAMHTALDELLTREGSNIQDKNHALVNVSEHNMALVVLRNGEALYTRDAAFGFGQLLSDIVMRYGVSEASAIQIIDGKAQAPEGFDALRTNHVQSAVQEIQRSLQLFMTSTSHIGVEAIFLHGEGALMEGLDVGIAQGLGVACNVLDPFKGIEISSEAASKGLALHASSLVVACGLAFRRFDL